MAWIEPPERFATCDPGKEHAAVSVFVNKRVVGAKKFTSMLPWPQCVADIGWQAFQFIGPGLQLFTFEWPEIRHAQGKAHIAADLFWLAGMDLALVAALSPAVSEDIRPSLWKGTVDGDVLTRRVQKQATADELAVVGKGDHNIWDSVGIGYWKLSRLHPDRR